MCALAQASSEHSVCFAVPESESDVVASALAETFERAIESGRISTVSMTVLFFVLKDVRNITVPCWGRRSEEGTLCAGAPWECLLCLFHMKQTVLCAVCF